jgi:cupin 2 domain-containing protein
MRKIPMGYNSGVGPVTPDTGNFMHATPPREMNPGNPETDSGSGNLLSALPATQGEEHFETLVATAEFRLERIMSRGHCSPAGFWYDQPRAEWVALLQGRAALRFEDESEARHLDPGDWVFIPAHRRHRVEWTSREPEAIWLALHFRVSTEADGDRDEPE